MAVKVASPKQVGFARDLVLRKATGGLPASLQELVIKVEAGTDLSGKEVGTLIDWLLASPNKPLAEADKAKPGYYVREGEVFVVVENKAKTATYAKRMVLGKTFKGKKGTWNYAPGVGRNIAHEGLEPLTIEAACALGHLHGACMICGRELTVAKSVAAGIGPVCIKKLGF